MVVDSLAGGGTQRQMRFLCRGLVERGHQIKICALNRDDDPEVISYLNSVAEVEVIGKLLLICMLGPFGLVRRLAKWKPDIILTLLPYADILGRMAGRIYGKSVIVTAIQARNIDKPIWLRLLDKLTMNWADRVIFNSASVVPFSRRNEGVKSRQVQVIANGVELDQEVEGPDIRAQLDLANNVRLILCVGRLRPQKRLDLAIEAFSLLGVGSPPTHLVIAGCGPLESVLKTMVTKKGLNGRVHFLGHRHDVPSLLRQSDCFLLSSDWEGQPNVVLEAMAAECPVVSTRVDGVEDLIVNEAMGWLADKGSTQSIVSALTSRLSNDEDALSRARCAKQWVSQQYSCQKLVDRYENLFHELLASRSTP